MTMASVRASNDGDQATMAAILRSQLYQLLADSFRRPSEPGSEWAGDLVTRWRQLTDLLDDAAFRVGVERLAQTPRTALAAEHDRLFEPHAGLCASPYETEYTKDTPQHAMSQQHEMADIAGFYRAFGFDVAEDRCDHLVAELEYLYAMAAKEADARASGQLEQAQLAEAAQRDFLKDHLGRWAARFSHAVIEAKCAPFYETLSELLEFWVAVDQNYLRSADSPSDGPLCVPDSTAS